jgi:UDP-N-acetylmuramate: L-alanyl-gamma-D-glutamyl-meso-diaminopimelate ligase
MHIHFIAIGGSVMHNLAIALHKKGYKITGSDDEITEPSKSRLNKYGLLPEKNGWFPENIDSSVNAIILGMHARIDNPELIKAQELGIKIYSYPEYIFEQTKDKKRIVVGGSHGKTTITSMIMHVLKYNNYDFDYLVGSQLEGFETMVHLEKNSKIAVFEGDEYFASPLDKRPKFHIYKPNIAIINGIEWDHINVYPTFEQYIEQFRLFIECIEAQGILLYFSDDRNVTDIVKLSKNNVKKIGYSYHSYEIIKNKTYIIYKEKKYPLYIFGEHNMQNIMAAKLVCDELGIEPEKFYRAISNFKGSAKRLEPYYSDEQNRKKIFIDFAHAPSKVKATIKAVINQFTDYNIIACLELHTFSSLNVNFLPQYKNSMEGADKKIVYYDPKTIMHKNLPEIKSEEIKQLFGDNEIEVFTSSSELKEYLKSVFKNNSLLLLMSSGTFGGLNFKELVK